MGAALYKLVEKQEVMVEVAKRHFVKRGSTKQSGLVVHKIDKTLNKVCLDIVD